MPTALSTDADTETPPNEATAIKIALGAVLWAAFVFVPPIGKDAASSLDSNVKTIQPRGKDTLMGMVQEFQEFIEQGNAMDMAVGVIIGGAFSSIVTALTDDIINPIIQFACGGTVGEDGVAIGGLVVPGTTIDFGAFISAIINFLIIAVILFLMVKAMNTAREKAAALAEKAGVSKEEEGEEAAPTCPHCLEEVKEGATRCPHCGGEISEAQEA